MTVDISLIPQERVQDLISTLDNIQNSLSNNLVHKSGTETISGEKTFTSYTHFTSSEPKLVFKSSDMDITQSGWAAGRNSIAWCEDKNGYESGGIYNNIGNNDDKVVTSLYAMSRKTGTQQSSFIRVGVDGLGNAFTEAPAPSSSNSTSSTNIATVGWINDSTKSTNVVHRSGDETIDGNKTFTGYTSLNTPTIKKQNTENEGGQIYFERSDGDVTMNDNNNHPYIDFWSGKFRFIGQSSSQTGSSVNIPFSVDIQNNCLCHGNSMKVMNYVVETYMSGTSWYRVWSDGWIEQGGQFVGSTNINASTTTVTFIKPFISYVAIAGGFTKSSNSAPYGQNLWQNGNTTLTTMVCSLPAYSSNGNVNHASSAGTGYWYACGY